MILNLSSINSAAHCVHVFHHLISMSHVSVYFQHAELKVRFLKMLAGVVIRPADSDYFIIC